jgi:hypothetical protein
MTGWSCAETPTVSHCPNASFRPEKSCFKEEDLDVVEIPGHRRFSQVFAAHNYLLCGSVPTSASAAAEVPEFSNLLPNFCTSLESGGL